MPTPWVRDLEKARKGLTAWLRAKLPGASDVRLSELVAPSTSGFSNETLLFDADWTEGGKPRREALVIRIQPTGFQVFPEYDMRLQYRCMELLGPTDVPVPKVFWLEEDDTDVLGSAFYVMGQVKGRVPSDNPPYNTQGWLTECTPDEVASIWWGCIDNLAKIHRIDAKAAGFGFLDRPRYGASGIDQQLAYYREYLTWAKRGRPAPTADAALDWLEANKPSGEPLGIVWGDARIGNIIFDGVTPAAVVDWEMATLGSPETDLAWAIFVDRYHSESMGVERLSGFPSYEATVERYQELSGHEVKHLHYYTVFAGLRFSVVTMRIAQQLLHYELMDEQASRAFELDNGVSQLLAKDLGLPAPSSHVAAER